jgi:tetratricopeptide (TPR) repeat protein
MRQARRQRVARRQEAWALRWSRAGRHGWAIDAANEAVALRRPVAEQQPAAMARALAVRAACLHVRGRTAEAAGDVDECLAFRGRANGASSTDDLVAVASLLDRAGRADEALALAEQLLADARALPQQRPSAPMLVYGELLLRRGRAEEAVAALREAYAAATGWSGPRIQASGMLFEALAAAGRHDELQEHAHRDLWLFAANAWGNIQERLVYLHLLELLEHRHIVSGRLPPLEATIARQRRKLLRQRRRRWVLMAALAVLTGRSREVPDRPRATGSADTGRAAALARAAQAEADIERHRESGDVRALSEAWGALAQARWQAGGQRSAALEAQRIALAEARRWAAEDPDEARPALVMHLRRFADFAGIIGLRTDAQLAWAEAEDLDRADR